MSRRQVLAALCCAVVGCNIPAHAFKAGLHELYAVRAGNWLRQCPGSSGELPGSVDIEALARGARREDDATFERLANWHYARTEAMPRYFIFPPLPPLRTDLESIFERRVDDLHSYARSTGCTRSGVFERAGRVLHYIQDMRVPAHVIPVHHGPGEHDDEFDGFPFRYRHITQGQPAACTAWKERAAAAKSGVFTELLSAARKETRARIHQPLMAASQVPEGCTWARAFWCDPAKEHCEAELPGFGRYRESGFGQRRVKCLGKDLVVEEGHYEDFFENGYREMLGDTAVVLLVSHGLAGACSTH